MSDYRDQIFEEFGITDLYQVTTYYEQMADEIIRLRTSLAAAKQVVEASKILFESCQEYSAKYSMVWTEDVNALRAAIATPTTTVDA